MSRVFTIIVILLLMAVVALVPRIGTEEEGPDLGDGHTYRVDTLARFRLVLEDEAWTLADPPRNPQGMLEAVHERTGLTFVLIPAGSFLMGLPESQDIGPVEFARWAKGSRAELVTRLMHRMYSSNAKPARMMTLDAFLLCRTECLQGAWDRVGGNDSRTWSGKKLPIEGVTWVGSLLWCERAGLRLPLESEWEYGCRAGSTTRYPTGSEPATLQGAANVADAALKRRGNDFAVEVPEVDWSPLIDDGHSGTAPAGIFKANRWGLLNTLGNVQEWCADPYPVPQMGPGRIVRVFVVRGGSWRARAFESRSFARSFEEIDTSSASLGFRPAADLPDMETPVER